MNATSTASQTRGNPTEIRGVSSSSVFPDATCAFENGGWLLMLRRKPPVGGVEEDQAAVFLIHPGTGRRLDLPVAPYGSANDGGLFVFYVDSRGTPLVVTRVETLSFVPTVHVACPGNVYWSVYEHDVDVDVNVDPPPPCASRAPRRRRRLLEPASIVDVALLGTQAVCLDANGEILVFDVAEMTWRRRTPAVRLDSGFGQYARSLVTAGGEVLLVSRPRTAENNAFRFFKPDMEALEWSPLERRELEDASWFLRRGHQVLQAGHGGAGVVAAGAPGAGGRQLVPPQGPVVPGKGDRQEEGLHVQWPGAMRRRRRRWLVVAGNGTEGHHECVCL
jgi:hypothetical protein